MLSEISGPSLIDNMVPLGEAIELVYGKNLPKKKRLGGNIPVYGSNGIVGWHNEAIVHEPTVIVGRKGSAGAVQYVEAPCFPIDTTYFVRPRAGFEFDIQYLYYLLKKLDLSRLRTATGVPGLTRDDAYKQLIPIPPIEEQRRIVDILKRADGIRRLREQAQDTARQLIPALFIEMFGDPTTNSKGWPIRTVSDFVERFEGGKNLKAGSDIPENCRILKVSAVTSGIYKESESKPAPDDYVPPESHYVREGDLLFSRANTEALVGATALVDGTNGKTLLPDKLWRIVLAAETEPAYIYALFHNPHVRQELSKLSTGTSASMRNISQGKLKALKLPIAPIAEQKRFAEQVRQAQAIQKQQSMAFGVGSDTFNSVMVRAFTSAS